MQTVDQSQGSRVPLRYILWEYGRGGIDGALRLGRLGGPEESQVSRHTRTPLQARLLVDTTVGAVVAFSFFILFFRV